MNVALINFFARRIIKGQMDINDVPKEHYSDVIKVLNEKKKALDEKSNSSESSSNDSNS